MARPDARDAVAPRRWHRAPRATRPTDHSSGPRSRAGLAGARSLAVVRVGAPRDISDRLNLLGERRECGIRKARLEALLEGFPRQFGRGHALADFGGWHEVLRSLAREEVQVCPNGCARRPQVQPMRNPHGWPPGKSLASCRGHLVGENPKARERARAERGHHRDVGRVATARHQDAPDARHVVRGSKVSQRPPR